MTDTEKLNLILRGIVTVGGPDQPDGMADEVFMLKIFNWLMRIPPTVTEPCETPSCGCKAKP